MDLYLGARRVQERHKLTAAVSRFDEETMDWYPLALGPGLAPNYFRNCGPPYAKREPGIPVAASGRRA